MQGVAHSPCGGGQRKTCRNWFSPFTPQASTPQTQVIRLQGKCLYLLRHFTGQVLMFLHICMILMHKVGVVIMHLQEIKLIKILKKN